MKQSLETLIAECANYQVAVVQCSNNFKDAYQKYALQAAFGVKKSFLNPTNLDNSSFAMGFIGYDFKNSIHPLASKNKSIHEFPDFFFFEPDFWYREKINGKIKSNINTNLVSKPIKKTKFPNNWQIKTSKNEYIKTVELIKSKIIEGTFYEMNYCIFFEHELGDFDPYSIFITINKSMKSPHSYFVKYHNQYILCFSPERFLTKHKNTLIAQPIKGTLKIKNSSINDINSFKKNPKERAENIMITDLTRNDLSKICQSGSVKVPKLCKLVTFSHVYHLVSTIKGELLPNVNFSSILKAAFPMGSMTGAPKLEVMKHTDDLENFKRGIYSGSIGYIDKNGFDLNVVIRSIMRGNLKWYYSVGSAITFDSDPEKEFEECFVKLSGIITND